VAVPNHEETTESGGWERTCKKKTKTKNRLETENKKKKEKNDLKTQRKKKKKNNVKKGGQREKTEKRMKKSCQTWKKLNFHGEKKGAEKGGEEG